MQMLLRVFNKRPSTIYSTSYPKTGNTWVRMLLGRYLQQLKGLPYLPLFEGTNEEAELLSSHSLPRIAFSHGPLLWDTQTAEDLTEQNVCIPYLQDRVLLLTRYPLDALLSNFMHFHYNTRVDAARLPPNLDAFARDPIFGLSKFIRFHNLWAAHLPSLSIHILRYEDMRADAAACIEKLLRFFRLPVDRALVRDAVNFASFENMRKMEEAASPIAYRSSGFRVFGRGDKSNPNAFHVRQGMIGGYREHFTPEQAAEYESKITEELAPIFGYVQIMQREG